MWDIVWVSLQGHRSVSVSRHFLLQVPQCPCFVPKRFSRDHCWRGRSKPGCWVVGSPGCRVAHQVRIDHLNRLPVMPPSTFDVNWLQVQPQLFPGCQLQQWWAKDIRLDWPTVMFDDFLHQLVSGSLIRRAGGSMLESTGSHGRGVEQRVPEMRRMVEFNCTSTRLV